ncbi:MAG: response regulator [Verrucomicrobiota bacterium]
MKRTRVLIIDDEESLTRLLKRNLERVGRFEVRTENSALDAVAAATEFGPEVILLDVMMPGMDGGEIAVDLREVPALRRVPIVFLTAAVTPEEVTRNDGFIAGFQYLAKPVDLDPLVEAIDRALRGSGPAGSQG